MQSTEWLDEQQAGEWLSVPQVAIEEAVKAGDLPALTIGGLVRISKSAVLGLAAGTGTYRGSTSRTAVVAPSIASGSLPTPKGLVWNEDLHLVDGFKHNWPDGTVEDFDSAREAVVTLNGERIVARIGQTFRRVGGKTASDVRGRLVVLFDGYPTCEFVKTADDSEWASIIKPDGKKTVPIGSPPPPLYGAAKVAPYREATGLKGIGIPNGLALVIACDDYRSAVHHAAARRLGRERYPVEPA